MTYRHRIIESVLRSKCHLGVNLPEFPDAVVARLVDLGLRVVHRPPDRAELHVVEGCAAARSAGLAHAVDLAYSCGF